MGRRTAVVTQADVVRAIRAAQAAGLTITRLVVRADGVALETTPPPALHGSLIGASPPTGVWLATDGDANEWDEVLEPGWKP